MSLFRRTYTEQVVPEETDRPVPVSRLRRLIAGVSRLYAISLLLAALTIVAFGLLTDEVLEQDLAEFDRGVLLRIHEHTTPTLDRLALAVTWLGSGWGVIALAALFTTLFLFNRRFIDTWTFLVVLAGGGTLSAVLKLVFGQARPALFTTLELQTNYSFPSGHSTISFSLWGFLAMWLIAEGPRELWRWIAASCALLLAALVAASRLYIGVHWPTDVFAGLLVGTFWVAVCFAGRERIVVGLERRRRRK